MSAALFPMMLPPIRNFAAYDAPIGGLSPRLIDAEHCWVSESRATPDFHDFGAFMTSSTIITTYCRCSPDFYLMLVLAFLVFSQRAAPK